MKKMTSLLLAALLTAGVFAGCSENGRVGQLEKDAKTRTEEDMSSGMDTAKEMMENEQGMIMAAGSRLQDVIMQLGEELGITMPEKLDESSLKEVFGVDPADIEEYYGEYSAVNTSADHIIGLKVKDGKVDAVRQALEARKEEIVKNFEEYLPDQYEKAQAGQIIQKGNYLFLVIAGDSEKGYDSEMDRAQKIVNGYFE
ncbi:DUF4358 domain-containing protein [uncultured Negativibacillus sp.]|uniref:DUF4358 domain-containing protein n=1 Tax=uncultured Negativibacillus sp. TaxID=1980696 RepID=UPI0026013010|nr:DUF4358 domain-containing protein [uncultured Negativibacillus sp.]